MDLGVTWANQPTTTGGAATAPSRTSPGYVEWTVTSQVYSREKVPDNPPQIVVTFD